MFSPVDKGSIFSLISTSAVHFTTLYLLMFKQVSGDPDSRSWGICILGVTILVNIKYDLDL